MKVKELIEKLSAYNQDMEIAIGDLQNNCCDKSIAILDDYYLDGGELFNKEDYDEFEWEDIVAEGSLIKTLLIV